MPEIGRHLLRHDQRATVDIEGMDHHQIIGEGEIFNRQSVAVDEPAIL